MIALAYPAFFEAFSDNIPGLQIVSDTSGHIDTNILTEARTIIFTGGSDINPALYNEANTMSYCDKKRDSIEVDVLNMIRNHFDDKKIVGVCRGHQLICSIIYGKHLVQDLNSVNLTHGSHHKLDIMKKGSVISNIFTDVNSIHHQGVRYSTINPRDAFLKIISSVYNDIVESIEDLQHNIITTQFHPEFMDSKESKAFFKFLIEEW